MIYLCFKDYFWGDRKVGVTCSKRHMLYKVIKKLLKMLNCAFLSDFTNVIGPNGWKSESARSHFTGFVKYNSSTVWAEKSYWLKSIWASVLHVTDTIAVITPFVHYIKLASKRSTGAWRGKEKYVVTTSWQGLVFNVDILSPKYAAGSWVMWEKININIIQINGLDFVNHGSHY